MSWSVYATGTKEKVRAYAEAEFDRQAKNYVSTPEYGDVIGAKAAVMAAIDTADMAPNAYVPVGAQYAVKVEAYGSRSQNSVSVHVAVDRVLVFA